DKAVLRKWLRSGFVAKGELFATEAVTPQGGIITPPTMVQNFPSIWRGRSRAIGCDHTTATASGARRCCRVGHPKRDGRITEAPMRRRKTHPPTLKIRVSHEVTRLEKQCMADAFERLLPIVERRLRARPDP